LSDLLKALDWERFELVCAGYFEELGFRAETVRGRPDGGVDVHLYTKDSRHPAIIVQCKAWRSGAAGVAVVRELLGVMTAAGVKEGVIATTSTFTTDAKSFAMGKEVLLGAASPGGSLTNSQARRTLREAGRLPLRSPGRHPNPEPASRQGQRAPSQERSWEVFPSLSP